MLGRSKLLQVNNFNYDPELNSMTFIDTKVRLGCRQPRDHSLHENG